MSTTPTEPFEVCVENQFSLREDLVNDARGNVWAALGNKKGKHAGDLITGLLPVEVHADEESKCLPIRTAYLSSRARVTMDIGRLIWKGPQLSPTWVVRLSHFR